MDVLNLLKINGGAAIGAVNPHLSADFYYGGVSMPVCAASLRNLVRKAG
jgi:hypothetical protein